MSDRHRVTWSPAAVEDLEGTLDHVAMEHGLAAAEALHDKVLTRVASLERHPRRCRIVPELKTAGVTAYRELIIAPYRVMFRIEGGIVGIAAFVDGRRDLDELLVLRGLSTGR